MDAEIQHAREEIRATQQRIGATIAEIESQIAETASNAAARVNPLTYAREYPWVALGLALGAGLAIALSGADAAAAGAVVAATKRAGNAMADEASALKERAADLAHRDGSEPSEKAEAGAHTPTPASERDLSGGLKDTRIAREIAGLLTEGLDDLLGDLGRRRPSAERRLAAT